MLLLLACSAGSDDPLDSGETGDTATSGLDYPVGSPGPFLAGFRSWPVTYTPGPDIPARTVTVSLWYPTEATEGEQARDTLGFLLPDTWLDAPMAEPVYPAGYPVVAHSHGYQGWVGNSAFLGWYFATHGWLFVGPDHTDNTLYDYEPPLPTAHYFERPLDIRATLDALEAEADIPADTSQVLLSGHSFGAFTTWATGGASYDLDQIYERCDAGEVGNGECTEAERAMFATDLSDSRVIATMPMAGSYDTDWFGETGYRTVQGPVFAMSGTEDDVGDDEQWKRMTDVSLTWLEIVGGCHQTFGTGSCSTIDAAEGYAIIDTYALAWARARVLGDDDPTVTGLLTGTVSASELAILHTR